MPYAIMGLTGQVGGAIARHLLRQGKPVCGIVRDPKKAADWQAQGVELVVAESTDAAALRAAFEGVDGAFIMLPPFFAPSPDFREARAVARAVVSAVEAARPPRLVQLSTVGGHHDHAVGILAQLHIFENALAAAGLPVPTAVLRPAWFMENAAWDVASAREGVINSFLQPLDRPIAMAATDDIGRAAAELLLGSWTGRRVVELEGPRRYSPDDLAAAFAGALGRPVAAVAVPRDTWDALFRSQGATDPSLRIEMLDGFNSGWIEFEGGTAIHARGRVELSAVIRELVARK